MKKKRETVDNPLMRRLRAAEQTAAVMRLVMAIESVALVVVSVLALTVLLTSTSRVDSGRDVGQTVAHTSTGALDVLVNSAQDSMFVRMKTDDGWLRIGHVVQGGS